MIQLNNLKQIKKQLNDLVFDGWCDIDRENLWCDFENKFNNINGFKEDIDGWGEGYYVCVDKNNNILFKEVSISGFLKNEYCINFEDGLYFNYINNDI